MNTVYVTVPVAAFVGFAAFFYWTATPNPWRSADYTKNRGAECSRHGVLMEKRKVRISYGGEASPPDRWVFSQIPRSDLAGAFLRAEHEHFPNAQESVFGGDAIPPRAPEWAHIYVCRECVEALKAWKKEANKSVSQRRGADAPQRG